MMMRKKILAAAWEGFLEAWVRRIFVKLHKHKYTQEHVFAYKLKYYK